MRSARGPRPAVSGRPVGRGDRTGSPGRTRRRRQQFDPGAVPVGLYGHHAVVGPLTAPGRPGCPQCLTRRWQAVRANFLRDALELGREARAHRRPAVAGGLRRRTPWPLWSRRPPGSRARHTIPWVWLLDLETLHVSRVPLVPDGECPSCGTPSDDSADAARIALEPTPEHAPGSLRLRPLDAYELRLEAFANPVTGMLGPSVAPDYTSASTSSAVGSFTARSGDYLRELLWGGHTGAYGTSVRVGLLEGLERFAGMRARAQAHRGLRDPRRTRRRTPSIPRVAGLYSDAFHRSRAGRAQVRPGPADHLGVGLVAARPPARAGPRGPGLLPRAGRPAERFVQESSNGCASGGALAEAVYHGLMEAVERDAFLLAWYGRARLPEIDPSSSTVPATRAMVDRLAMYGYRARFFDTRITFPIPVVTAVAERVDGGPGLLCFGAGAALDPEAALAGGAVRDRHRLGQPAPPDRPRRAPAARAWRPTSTRSRSCTTIRCCTGCRRWRRYADFLLRDRDDAERARSPRWPRAPAAAALLRRPARRRGALRRRGHRPGVRRDRRRPDHARAARRWASTPRACWCRACCPIDFGWTPAARPAHAPAAYRAARGRACATATWPRRPQPGPAPFP